MKPPPAESSYRLGKPLVLTSFFGRLSALDPIMRIITSDARISVLLTFRGQPEKRVLLDLSQVPLGVHLDDDTRRGDVCVTIDADIMHEIMLGRMKPGLALGRRQLLLRGNAYDLARFIPLFDFAPMLYREHLADLGLGRFARPRSVRSGRLQRVLDALHPWSGRVLGSGSARAPSRTASAGNREESGDVAPSAVDFSRPPQETQMNEDLTEDMGWGSHPARKRKLHERMLYKSLGEMAYALGYGIGKLRYRFMQNLSLFDLLESMARGVSDAMPESTRNLPS